MNSKKIENILSMTISERYAYFIRKVAEYEELWGLDNDGWASFGGAEKIVLPFWPEMEFAELCCTGQWQEYKPRAISLNDFMEKWMPSMINDKRLANIFYIPDSLDSSLIEPQILLEDLTDEMQKYQPRFVSHEPICLKSFSIKNSV